MNEANKEKKTVVKQERLNRNFWSFLDSLNEFFKDLIDLRDGLDKVGTIENIKNNRRMRGANAWLLMCSIMVASIGLDLNSTAVIIGAMLISPLMSPILGIGLAIGINDRETLITSLNHFGISIAIAIVTSFIYFYLTPFGNETDEILARTSPNLLDGLVAVFGGIAGIVSMSRIDKSNAIPGVAIATALMPPICVAGYGLANGNWLFFFNAFYLFFLNSFFIVISTYLVVRFLRFPVKAYVNRKTQQKTNLIILGFSLLMVIPSILILRRVFKEFNRTKEAKVFAEEYFNTNNRFCVGEPIFLEVDSTITYRIVGTPISDDSLHMIEEELLNYGYIKDYNLNIIQNNGIGTKEWKKLEDRISGVQGELSKKIQIAKQVENTKDIEIQQLKQTIDSLRNILPVQSIPEEASILFPNLKSIDITKSSVNETPILLVKWKTANRLNKSNQAKLMKYVKMRVGLDTLVVY